MNNYIEVKCRDGYILKGILYPSTAPKKRVNL